MTPGTKLGSYEILAPLGAGGMGEVYRARDAKLDREVAIKVLPASFAQNAERMARFRREAKLLASLSHPNIAAIYGVEDSGSSEALVMELAEGPTLADRIRQGPIPEALPIARQIADALEYAHERGVVHRDLKPANVKVSRDDSVKILDFGLAKAVEGEAAASVNGDSPTISEMATQAGVLLGTAGYMAPEQAKGKPVDRRADVWAFGCVLYEMLTGKQAFPGETAPEMLAAVLANEPDWAALPAETPVHVRVLLKRCLQKDPKQRLRDIGDARISLDEVLAGAPEAVPARATPIWRRAIPWALFGVAAIALATLGFFYFRRKPSAPAAPMRFQIALPEETTFVTTLALSPDGRHLVFMATQQGHSRLWVHDLDSLVSRPLPGTERGNDPFWSPDSHTIAFEAGGKLEKVDISGSAPQVLCNAPLFLGGSWNQSGVILFGTFSGLWRVSASGGAPSLLIKLGAAPNGFALAYPWFLPDGRRFLYAGPHGSSAAIYLGSLDARSDQKSSSPLVEGGWMPAYLPSSGPQPGHLLFLKPDDTLVAEAFDADRAKVEGDPDVIARDVRDFTVTPSGLLAYVNGMIPPFQLTWYDRKGKVLGTLGEPGVYPSPAISPDGRTVAVPRYDATGNVDIWLYDMGRGAWSRLTFDAENNIFPVWSPDGSRVAFASARAGAMAIYEKSVNGMGEEQLVDKTASGGTAPTDWSRDGRYLVEKPAGNTLSIRVLPLSPVQAGVPGKAFAFLKGPFNATNARLSPNGQWIAYDSDETGRDEIFVQTFPKPGGKWQVSTNGGTRPVWSRNGKELYFIGLDGNLMAAGVKSGPGGSFEAGAPKVLFNPHTGGNPTDTFDVSKDGRFLIPTMVHQPGSPITVVVNWQAALKK